MAALIDYNGSNFIDDSCSYGTNCTIIDSVYIGDSCDMYDKSIYDHQVKNENEDLIEGYALAYEYAPIDKPECLEYLKELDHEIKRIKILFDQRKNYYKLIFKEIDPLMLKIQTTITNIKIYEGKKMNYLKLYRAYFSLMLVKQIIKNYIENNIYTTFDKILKTIPKDICNTFIEFNIGIKFDQTRYIKSIGLIVQKICKIFDMFNFDDSFNQALQTLLIKKEEIENKLFEQIERKVYNNYVSNLKEEQDTLQKITIFEADLKDLNLYKINGTYYFSKEEIYRTSPCDEYYESDQEEPY